ncbi:MAG: DMT family transporter [Rhodobacteraceae bacterium]|nr:DMT family transporter [Paracoccaceae bacterium]
MIVQNPLRAAIVMVCAMAVIGVIDNFIIRLAGEIGLWQFHLIRSLMAVPVIVALSWLGLGQLAYLRFWAVLLRSILVTTAMMFYFSALALMSIAEALAGLFTSPIFILLISAVALRQRIGPWRILAVILGFVGILFVLQPDPGDFDTNMLIPMAGGFFYALGMIATRMFCAHESTVAMLLVNFILMGLVGAVGVIVLDLWPMGGVPGSQGFVTRGWVWPMWQALPWVGLQAVGSVIGVFLIIKAYQLGEPSFVSVFEYSVMIFGPLFAWVAFGQAITFWQIFGIALIAGAGGIIAVRSK